MTEHDNGKAALTLPGNMSKLKQQLAPLKSDGQLTVRY
jgi:hypothetical protein